MERLEGAKRALRPALKGLEKYRKGHEVLRLRSACEKGRLAVISATDILLTGLAYRRPESYSEGRGALEDLGARCPKASELGLRDKFGARGYYLHVRGYRKGWW